MRGSSKQRAAAGSKKHRSTPQDTEQPMPPQALHTLQLQPKCSQPEAKVQPKCSQASTHLSGLAIILGQGEVDIQGLPRQRLPAQGVLGQGGGAGVVVRHHHKAARLGCGVQAAHLSKGLQAGGQRAGGRCEVCCKDMAVLLEDAVQRAGGE